MAKNKGQGRDSQRLRNQRNSAPLPSAQGAYVPATYGSTSQYSRNSAAYSARHRGMSTGAKIAVAIIVIAAIAAIAGLGFYVFKETQKSAINADLHKMSEEEMVAVDNELTGSITFDKPFNMLLLGSDARSDDPDMGARTDTVILVRVDATTNTLTMVSIPRDTKITIPGVGDAKFNAAYTYGGPSGTIAAVKELTGVDIDHYAEINFEGLVDLIDAIGGIDVMVEERIDDPDAGPVVIEEGMQHLDGAAALTFSRTRHYADGDFTRQRHQRMVIEAIMHRALEAPATELQGLIQTSTKFVTTDSAVDFDFIYSLADQIRHNEQSVTMYSANIPSTTAMIGDVSYVIADTAGIRQMMEVFSQGGDVGAISNPESSIDEDLKNAGGSTNSNTANTTNNATGGTGYVDYGYDNVQPYNYGYDNTQNYGYDNTQNYGYDNTQNYGYTDQGYGNQGYDNTCQNYRLNQNYGYTDQTGGGGY